MRQKMRQWTALLLAVLLAIFTPTAAYALDFSDVISNSQALQTVEGKEPFTESQKQTRKAAQQVGAEITAEGCVLLKNKGVLPLKTAKLNVFGVDSAEPYLGGRGSATSDNSFGYRFYTALENQGISYNRTLYNLYKNWAENGEVSTESYPQERTTLSFQKQSILSTVESVMANPYPDELPADNLTDSIMGEAKKYSDTAVIMIGRAGSEQHDSTPEELALQPNEKAMVDRVCRTFDNVIVLFNTADIFEMGFLNEYPSIKAAMFIGYPAQTGMNSVVRILKGEISPSGHTADTFYYHTKDHPGYRNTGTFEYQNARGRKFLDYKEDIYVGYRYAETFLKGKAYWQKVQFPFGYGLSYTTFSWSKPKLKVSKKDGLTAEIKVKNTGKTAGKDLVQIYIRAPYDGTIEKPDRVLAGYQKTDLLKPSKSQNIKIKIPWDRFASFDTRRGCYVLSKGSYEAEFSKNAHTPLAVESFQRDSDLRISRDTKTDRPIQRRFARYEGSFRKLSRKDGPGALPEAPDKEDYIAPDSIVGYPRRVNTISGHPNVPDEKIDLGIRLDDLKNKSYTDKEWDAFISQLSIKEMIRLVNHGGYQTSSVERLGIPQTNASDGPGGIHDSVESSEGVSYPSGTLIGCTWNPEMSYAWGGSIGREARYMHVQEWYGPSLNLHRTPFGGRCFEYMSEDPYLIGSLAAASVQGAQSQGLVCYIKHFSLNEEDANRTSVHTWASEQAIREIYTKPFEYAVKEGGAHGVMSALNCIGDKWCGECPELLTGLLREEWGFQGCVVTDYAGFPYQRADSGVLAGNDLWLAPTGNFMYRNMLERSYVNHPKETEDALRRASKDICYMVLQTNLYK